MTRTSLSNLPLFTVGALCAAVALAAPTLPQTRVVDGDTLVYQGERIRIWGLDCAEMNQPLGRRAKEAMRLLTDGNIIRLERVTQSPDTRAKCRAYDARCKSPGHCDCYGRTVAKVLIQRTSRGEFFTFDAACAMIQSGACREYTHYSLGYYARCKP